MNEFDLFNENNIKKIFKHIEKNQSRLALNSNLFDIYENEIGDLLRDKVLADLGENTYEQVKERIVPINVLKKIIDKLSKIYQQKPKREVTGSEGKQNETDQAIVDKFVEIFDMDHKMNSNNEFWNLYMYSLLQIGNHNNKPFIRSIPNHKYLTMSTSQVDPTSDDLVILFMGSVFEGNAELKIIWVYSDTQFAIYDSRQVVRTDMMDALGQDGTLPYNGKPFGYINASENLEMPKEQNDTLDMTLLVPLLLTDTSYIAKFTTFSTMYGIDVDDKDMKRAPNIFWNFKSDAESDKKPEIGTVDPNGDIDKLLSLVITVLDLWLSTKGIKSGSIGTLTANNIASGISKMIDEADVTDIRNFQATIYSRFEAWFWDYLLRELYPFWKEQGMIENFGEFSPNAKVVTTFTPQTPLVARGARVLELRDEMDAGLTTQRRALMELNPQMSGSEIDQLIKDIDDEKELEVIVDGTEQNGNKTQFGNT